MKHKLNGARAAAWDAKRPITVIAIIATNGIFPGLAPEEPPVRPLQQVTLRPDMLSDEGLLRLGQTPGDEANGWIHPRHILIVEVLGAASWEGSTLKVDEDALERADIRAA